MMTLTWNHLVMNVIQIPGFTDKNHPIEVEDEENEDEDDDNDASGGGAFGSHDDINFNYLYGN